jgi:hypothetical protein
VLGPNDPSAVTSIFSCNDLILIVYYFYFFLVL